MRPSPFEGPIPGQSLTETPGNRPYERPPETVDPEEALQIHLMRLSEPQRVGALIDAIGVGFDIKSLTTGVLRSAVANGIHTVDISLIIAPVVHEYIKKIADEAGVEYDEGLVNEGEEKEKRRKIEYAKAKKKLQKEGYFEKAKSAAAAVPTDTEELPSDTGELDLGEPVPDERPSGIMKRREEI